MKSEPQLIFLISQPRAGSTLLQRMLGCHSMVATTSEPWLMLPLVYALRRNGHQANYNPRWAASAIHDFCETLPDGIEAYYRSVRRTAMDLYNAAAQSAGKPCFLDKTPRYYFIIDELIDIFPDARFIVLLRNPMAVFASILRTWVHDDPTLLRLYRHDVTTAPKLIADAMDRHPDCLTVVRYEDMVIQPEAVIGSLCDRIGLPFESSMIEFGSATAPDTTWRFGDTTRAQSSHRPDTASLESWVETVTARRDWRCWARDYLDRIGPALLTRLGYDHARLQRQLDEHTRTSGRSLISLSMALAKPEEWTTIDRLRLGLARALQGAASRTRLIEPVCSGASPVPSAQ